MSMIKILIADDQELIRQSLQIMLSSVSNFTVTDTVSNGLEVLESVRREKASRKSRNTARTSK